MARPRNGVSTRFLLDFYDACLREDCLKKVAACMEIGPRNLRIKVENNKALQLAKQLAEERRGSRDTLADYVYGHLSDEAKGVWDKLQFWEENEKGVTRQVIEAVFIGKKKQVRQELFLHALVRSGYNASHACHMVGITRFTLNAWRQEEDFRKLIDEIQWHKKNFFEHALMDLVEQRHPGAVIFVNRTVNQDRGYGERVQIDHSGLDREFSVADLDLPLEVRKQILDAIRKKRESTAQAQPLQLNAPPEAEPIDV